MFEIFAVGCLIAFLVLCFGIITDPEGVAEAFHKFVYGMHRFYVRLWNRLEFRAKDSKKAPVKYKDRKIGEVTKSEFKDGGLVATMRIDDDMVRKALTEGIGTSFSFGHDSLGDTYLERLDGTRQAIDVKTDKDKVRDGEMTINQARKNAGMSEFLRAFNLPPMKLDVEGLHQAMASISRAGASMADVVKNLEKNRQARYTRCKKHRFKIKNRKPMVLNEKPTHVMELEYSCRNCGMKWVIPDYYFKPHTGVSGLQPGREPMGSIPDHFIIVCKFGEVCSVHNRSHGDWKCLEEKE